MKKKAYKFEMGDKVKLCMSEETGIVMGRAEYTYTENNYYVRYRAADGRMVESWWGESAIEPIAPKKLTAAQKSKMF